MGMLESTQQQQQQQQILGKLFILLGFPMCSQISEVQDARTNVSGPETPMAAFFWIVSPGKGV